MRSLFAILLALAVARMPAATPAPTAASCDFASVSVPRDWVPRRLDLASRSVRVPRAFGPAMQLAWMRPTTSMNILADSGAHAGLVIGQPGRGYDGLSFGNDDDVNEVFSCQLTGPGVTGGWRFYDVLPGAHDVPPFAAEGRITLPSGERYIVDFMVASAATRRTLAAAVSTGMATP